MADFSDYADYAVYAAYTDDIAPDGPTPKYTPEPEPFQQPPPPPPGPHSTSFSSSSSSFGPVIPAAPHSAGPSISMPNPYSPTSSIASPGGGGGVSSPSNAAAGERDLENLFDRVWTGYGAGGLNHVENKNGNGNNNHSPTSPASTRSGSGGRRPGRNTSTSIKSATSYNDSITRSTSAGYSSSHSSSNTSIPVSVSSAMSRSQSASAAPPPSSSSSAPQMSVSISVPPPPPLLPPTSIAISDLPTTPIAGSPRPPLSAATSVSSGFGGNGGARNSRPLPLPPGASPGSAPGTVPTRMSTSSVHSSSSGGAHAVFPSLNHGDATPNGVLDSPVSVRGRQLPMAPGSGISPASVHSTAAYFDHIPPPPPPPHSHASSQLSTPVSAGLGSDLGLGLALGPGLGMGSNSSTPTRTPLSSVYPSGSDPNMSSGRGRYEDDDDGYWEDEAGFGNVNWHGNGSSSQHPNANPPYASPTSYMDPPPSSEYFHSVHGSSHPQTQSHYDPEYPLAPNDRFSSYDPDAAAVVAMAAGKYDADGYYIGVGEGDGLSDTSSYDEDPSRFVNFSLLSHIGVQLKDKVPRGIHVKGSIPYPGAFTGKDVVSTIQSLIQRELAINHGVSTSDRRAAVQVARSLQSQLFFYEVEWGGRVLQDGVEDVYMFLDDLDGGGGGGSSSQQATNFTELPTGVVTALTKCYSPDCVEGVSCYSPRCPRKGDSVIGPSGSSFTRTVSAIGSVSDPTGGSMRQRERGEEWIKSVPREVLDSLPESEINRQTIIHKLISKEEQYLADLDIIETVFIRPLKESNPPLIKARNAIGGGTLSSSSPTTAGNNPGPLYGGNGAGALNGFNGGGGGGGTNGYGGGVNGVYGNGAAYGIDGSSGGIGSGAGGAEDREALFQFVDEVFNNVLDLRETNRRLLEILYVRQREQFPIIQRVGDIFLEAATELFRVCYPLYIGGWTSAEKRLREEMEVNGEFRVWLEQAARQAQQLASSSGAAPSSASSNRATTAESPSASSGQAYGASPYGRSSLSDVGTGSGQVAPAVVNASAPRLDLKHYLNRPSEHLQKYPVLLTAILNETADGNPDAEFLHEAIEALGGLQQVAQLRTFQQAMGRGGPGKWEWHDLVAKEIRDNLDRRECKRQSIMFELIKGEMAYVKDLENIDIMYIRPLREADPPVIPRDRVESFINDVFHNFAELHAHHRRLVEKFHQIQTEEHPVIRSITAAVFDAALNFREAYMEYIPNYPIAAYRIDDEMANNPAFKTFVEQCVRHADAHRLDMKNFINRPIPRLLRYELLLKGILDDTPEGHEDRIEIPQVLEVIKAIGKDTEPGVVSAKQKVELWRYNSNIVFKPGEWIDMDLLDKNRSLIHTGRLLRQPDSGLEWSGWSELFVLLFDNYLVMTKAREKDSVTKYFVNRRPIPLDLLNLVNFTDPPAQRGAGLLRGLRGGERHNTDSSNPLSALTASSSTGASGAYSNSANTTPDNSRSDPRSVYPCTIHHNGRMGGNYILYGESAAARTEWKDKLEEAIGLRKVVQESNKVFEIETLSTDTFLAPTMIGGGPQAANVGPSYDNTFTGKVTCSVPFNTPDGRGLVAIGCAEGVWIGFRHDSRSMRRVLHLKMVTQCAMLEDFGIFLVLADKSLFAYHIEALVPSSPSSSHSSQTPQKLSGNKDVYFFSVGTLHGRTLVIYMKKKGLDSIFHVVEPVQERINERSRAPQGLMGSRFSFRPAKSDWFRAYREFFLPSESFDLIFLKVKIAILCAKGFEIMDLMDLQSVTIPQRDDPRHAPLAKRWEGCKPLGMFRSTDEEFLLCYTEFGLYVNKHGDPSRLTGSIEWEGTAERVALHPPYILLFDSRFIEVRHIQTGRLAQIIPGHDVRCLWDGRGVNMPNQTPGGPNDSDEHIVQEARVHAVMNADPVKQNGVRPSRAVAQHVFELIPTIPLYLPGSLASPTTATYFPPSFSPPHSPTLRPNTIYRS